MEAAGAGPIALRPHRRPRRAALCAGRAHAGAADASSAGCCAGAGWHDSAADRGRGADHHLPLRAGARRAGGAGRRRRRADARRAYWSRTARAGAAGRGRHRRVRQDRHADARPPAPQARRCWRAAGRWRSHWQSAAATRCPSAAHGADRRRHRAAARDTIREIARAGGLPGSGRADCVKLGRPATIVATAMAYRADQSATLHRKS